MFYKEITFNIIIYNYSISIYKCLKYCNKTWSNLRINFELFYYITWWKNKINKIFIKLKVCKI